MDKKVLISTLLCLCLTAGLNMGTIRKEQDPILKTQTDPIGYKQKMDEIKDGEKEAPQPSMTFYAKPQFMTDSPMKTPKEEVAQAQTKKEEESFFEEPSGENQITETPNLDEDWWVDDEKNPPEKPEGGEEVK